MKYRALFHSIASGTLLVALSACGESPSDTCPAGSCVGSEADLAVTEVAMTSTVHDANGVAVVHPGAIDVRVVVRNNGGAASEEKPLQIKVRNGVELLMTLAPMKPGEERVRTIHLPAPAEGTFLIDSDTTSVIVSIVGLDANRANDQRASSPFHLALPALRVTAMIPADVLLVDAPMPATVRIENVSRYASLAPSTFSYCIYDLGGVCSEAFRGTSFGSVTFPMLAAEQSLEIDHPVAVPAAATSRNVVDAYTIGTCLAPGTVTGGNPAIGAGVCAAVRDVSVRPDYETCNPVALVADQPARGSSVCAEPCEIVAFSVQAEAGHTYTIENADGGEEITLRWRTRYRDNPVDASPDAGFQPEASGKYYLVTAAKYCGDPEIRHAVVLLDAAPGPGAARR